MSMYIDKQKLLKALEVEYAAANHRAFGNCDIITSDTHQAAGRAGAFSELIAHIKEGYYDDSKVVPLEGGPDV